MRRIMCESWRWCGAVGIRFLPALLVGMALAADEAREVHVVEDTLVGGVRTELRDQTLLTGGDYTTQTAPAISGHIFTHWSISRTQDFVNRDRLGRAKDFGTYHLYEPMTLTANYLPTGEDADQDGVSDGWEIYWYGDLDESGTSDTDGDGLTFAEELSAGTNPLILNESVEGGIAWNDGEQVQYNVDGYQPYIIRSEPEGALFVTIKDIVKTGTLITTPVCNHSTTKFTYWTVNGVRQQDRHGRSLDQVSIAMPEGAVELVAVCVDEEAVRQQIYWYGKEMTPTSDTDGDGLTFAEELSAGTNPLIPNESVEGGIERDDGELQQYNIDGLQPYTIRSEPEGALFARITDIVNTGTSLSTPICNHSTSQFAYWTLNGVRQQDRYGRACDQVNFAMSDGAVELVAVCVADREVRDQLYWYGEEMPMTSDTDGDGMTLAEEIAAGTNPLIPNESVEGGIVWDDGGFQESDLQVYEQALGVVVDGKYAELFTSPISGNGVTSMTLANGEQIWPVVVDLNGDGLFDIVIAYDGGQRVFVNVGGKGNPEFRESEEFGAQSQEWLSLNSIEKLSEMTLDVQPTGALSATVWGEGTLLVSDVEGRIWYYKNGVLQHKVWGGSYAGFSNGLRIAAVDWDDDGDLDCLCGTAEGKLMLLRDPKIGRPTNVKVFAGVDNVLLEWDPNVQSRVRGYNVYRSVADVGAYDRIAVETPIPRYRDQPPVIQGYDYQVTSLSRFYTAGNSTPTVTESVPTEAVRAELGKVSLRWNDAVGFDNEEIAVALGIENSLNVAGGGLVLEISYDPEVLLPVRVETSGLTEGVTYDQRAADGVWTVTATGGEIAAGGGTLFTFVFDPIRSGEMNVGVREAAMKSIGGAKIPVVLPADAAKVTVTPFVEPEPVHATVAITESIQVTAGESFSVSVAVTGEGVDVTSLDYEYVFDTVLLSRSGNTFTAADVYQSTLTTIALTNVSVKATDGSVAVIDSVSLCAVSISTKESGEDDEGYTDEDDEIILDKDGNIVDWGVVPGILDPEFHFGRRIAGIKLGVAKGRTGDIVDIPVSICNEDVVSCGLLKNTTVDIKSWAFEVRYDERLVRPVGIAEEIGEYTLSATNGVLTVIGLDGTVELGRLLVKWKEPLKLKFELLTQYAEHKASLTFGAVQARTTDGKRIYTPIREEGCVAIVFVRSPDDPTVVVPCGRGDLNGDGRLTKEDKQLLADLMNGSPNNKLKWNEQQLAAGDYNGNGRLDQDDYQRLKDDFKAKGIK